MIAAKKVVSSLVVVFYCSNILAVRISRYKKHTNFTCHDELSFKCSSDECISQDSICDGVNDCPDGADETDYTCKCGISQEEPEINVTHHPWHAGIYRVRGDNLHALICSGTLIYPETILTAASCVYDLETSLPLYPSTVRVSLGTSIRDINTNESTQQKFNVTQILLLDGYGDDVKNFVKNLALLRLDQKVKINSYVRPICLWSDNKLPTSVSKIWMTGWGLQYSGEYSLHLRKAQAYYMDVQKCLKTYPLPLIVEVLTYDKFCVTFDQEEVGVREVDTGGPVSIFHEERYYLIGILSVPLQGTPNFTIATGIYRYLKWIRHVVNEFRRHNVCSHIAHPFYCDDGKCLNLKQVCDGQSDCHDGTDENQPFCFAKLKNQNDTGLCEIPEGRVVYELTECNDPKGCQRDNYASNGTVFTVKCPIGYAFEEPEINELSVICYQGKWYPHLENPCQKLCQPINSKSLLLKCQYRGQTVSCQKPLRPSTSVQADCLTNYQKEYRTFFVNETSCRLDGSLAHKLTECNPVCGIQNLDYQLLISHGKKTQPGRFPWHIGLYYNKNLTEESWMYLCGGTIISSNKVLTAAHCLYPSGKIIDAKRIAVKAGKYHLSRLKKDPFEQTLIVSKIEMEYYDGDITKFARDIAVLILFGHFNLNSYVLPACLALDLEFGELTNNQLGHLAGWGATEEGRESSILLETTMKYIDLKTCREEFKNDSVRSFLHADKFCMVYQNGSGPQIGDSGGGITFIHNGLHYIYGIVSLKSHNNTFTGVTNISMYKNWLYPVLGKN